MFPGMQERLQRELEQLTHAGQMKQRIKVHAPRERKYSPWVGASMLGSLSTFYHWCIGKEEYNEVCVVPL